MSIIVAWFRIDIEVFDVSNSQKPSANNAFYSLSKNSLSTSVAISGYFGVGRTHRYD